MASLNTLKNQGEKKSSFLASNIQNLMPIDDLCSKMGVVHIKALEIAIFVISLKSQICGTPQTAMALTIVVIS